MKITSEAICDVIEAANRARAAIEASIGSQCTEFEQTFGLRICDVDLSRNEPGPEITIRIRVEL